MPEGEGCEPVAIMFGRRWMEDFRAFVLIAVAVTMAIAATAVMADPRWPPKIPHLWPLQIPPLDEIAMM